MADRILQSISLLMVFLGITGVALNAKTHPPIAFMSLAWAIWFGYMGVRSLLRKSEK